MIRLIAARLGLGVVTFLVVTLIVFAGTQLLPGDVAQQILGQSATQETLAALHANDNIVSACVYSPDGKMFAVYERDGASSFVPPVMRLGGQEFTPTQRAASLIGRGTIRLSIGIEDLDDLTAFFAELLTGTPQTAAWRARLRTGIDPKIEDEGERERQVVALMLASPEVQLA